MELVVFFSNTGKFVTPEKNYAGNSSRMLEMNVMVLCMYDVVSSLLPSPVPAASLVDQGVVYPLHPARAVHPLPALTRR
jgi:hypothetical protein